MTREPPALKPHADCVVLALHWMLVVSLVVSFVTGLRIASDDPRSIAGIVARAIAVVLPEGAVVEVHLVSSVFVLITIFAYPVYLWRGRLARRVAPRLSDLRTVNRSILGQSLHDTTGWLSFNRLLHQAAFAFTLLLTATGLMLLTGLRIGLPYQAPLNLHGVLAAGMLLYAFLHVIAVFKAGIVGKMFRPRKAHLMPGVLAGAAVVTVLGTIFLGRDGMQTLLVPRTDVAPHLDGEIDAAWEAATGVLVRTARAANLPGGESKVEIRSMHDGEFIYFLFRWTDPQRSQKMTPLLKTTDGWMVLQTGLEAYDETDYYEDKLAVILSERSAVGSGTTHLGDDVLAGSGPSSARGLHFTRDGSIVDLWHWKSVRSGGMTPGHVDDNYIGPPLSPSAPGTRYTGGYTQDPTGEPHPYVQNWEKVHPELPLSATTVRPRFLPRDPSVLSRLDPIDLDPAASDGGTWSLMSDEVVPYLAELDDLPVGTVIPGTVIFGAFVGDRADVRGEAVWENGMWTLETRRLLDTGSPYDHAFQLGRDSYLWAAVFNHAQIRHSQHLLPVRLVIAAD